MNAKQFITIRVSRRIADEVRQLAKREDETQSTILRRLLRNGLRLERSNAGASPEHDHDEAA